jgi:hypothetical protein
MPEKGVSKIEKALSVIAVRQFAYINILEAMLPPEELAAAKQERDKLGNQLEYVANMLGDSMPAVWGRGSGGWQ